MRRKKNVVQPHHICYDPPIVHNMFQGEHWLIAHLNRRKAISKGFIRTLRIWIIMNEESAIELGGMNSCE